jgi:ABC-type bacteriocin/lantibiotic exporter with double-glycine peptidase domain
MLADIVWNEDTLAVVCVFAVPITAIVGTFWYMIERVKSDNELKRTMILQGKSVEEIERVIAAKSGKH